VDKRTTEGEEEPEVQIKNHQKTREKNADKRTIHRIVQAQKDNGIQAK
jgi:hypothetical protein